MIGLKQSQEVSLEDSWGWMEYLMAGYGVRLAAAEGL